MHFILIIGSSLLNRFYYFIIGSIWINNYIKLSKKTKNAKRKENNKYCQKTHALLGGAGRHMTVCSKIISKY